MWTLTLSPAPAKPGQQLLREGLLFFRSDELAAADGDDIEQFELGEMSSKSAGEGEHEYYDRYGNLKFPE